MQSATDDSLLAPQAEGAERAYCLTRTPNPRAKGEVAIVKIVTSLKMDGAKIFVGKYIKPVDSEELGGHQPGSLFVNMRVVVALRSSAVF